jgi:hypothetical protein
VAGGSITFQVDMREVVQLMDAIPAMRGIVEEEIDRAMSESGLLLTTMVSARTPVNFGILRSSIQFPMGFEVRGRPADVLEGLTAAGKMQLAGTSPHVYSNYVEFGRRPGKWPPEGPIQLWVMRKFELEGQALQDTTFLVRRAIGQKGTKGAKMFQRAWDEGGKTRVERFWQDVPVKAVRRFAGAVR